MTSLILSEMAVTYAVADITWWTSPVPLSEFRTASNEHAQGLGTRLLQSHVLL